MGASWIEYKAYKFNTWAAEKNFKLFKKQSIFLSNKQPNSALKDKLPVYDKVIDFYKRAGLIRKRLEFLTTKQIKEIVDEDPLLVKQWEGKPNLLKQLRESGYLPEETLVELRTYLSNVSLCIQNKSSFSTRLCNDTLAMITHTLGVIDDTISINYGKSQMMASAPR